MGVFGGGGVIAKSGLDVSGGEEREGTDGRKEEVARGREEGRVQWRHEGVGDRDRWREPSRTLVCMCACV